MPTDPNKKEVLVIGAGITGLTAAYKLRNDFNVTLLEASDRIGGKLHSVSFRDKPVDVGPDSFLTRNASAVQLSSELDLSEHLVAPVSQGASLYSRKQLRKLPIDLALGIPTNLISVLSSQIVSPLSAVRSAADFFWPKRLPDFTALLDSADKKPPQPTFGKYPDPSIGQLLNQRLGRATVERLIAPLIAGINAGDINCLSFAATTPELARAVSKKRSVVLSLREYRKPTAVKSAGSPQTPRPTPFLGFDTSLSTLTEALRQNLVNAGVKIYLNTKAADIKMTPHGKRHWAASILQKNMPTINADFDALLLAVPSSETANLLEASLPDIAALCNKIPFSSVATLVTAWKADEVPPIYGTGFLVARKPKKLITGVTALSSKWAHLSHKNEVWLKISAGHYLDHRAISLGDEELTAGMIEDTKTVLGMTGNPIESFLCRWENAFPQYNTGHIERILQIDALTAAIPSLAIAGASYHGIGIPACISDACKAADKLKDLLN